MSRLSAICILALLFLVSAVDAFAQREDDILRPVPFRFHVGPLAGFGYNASYGEFETVCDCRYSSGSGFGPMIGGFVDYPLTRDVSAYIVVTGQSLNASYDKGERRLEYVDQLGAMVFLDFKLETAVTLFYVGVGTLVKWETPVRGLYLAVGPELSFVAYDYINETERLETPGFVYVNSDSRETVFVDGGLNAYYDMTSWRLAVAGRLGYEIPLHQRLALAPELSVALPMTPVVADYNSWRIMPWRLNCVLRFAL